MPKRFDAIKNKKLSNTGYQYVHTNFWPRWSDDLMIGWSSRTLGDSAQCTQLTYQAATGDICGSSGVGNWGAIEVEVWRPRWY